MFGPYALDLTPLGYDEPQALEYVFHRQVPKYVDYSQCRCLVPGSMGRRVCSLVHMHPGPHVSGTSLNTEIRVGDIKKKMSIYPQILTEENIGTLNFQDHSVDHLIFIWKD